MMVIKFTLLPPWGKVGKGVWIKDVYKDEFKGKGAITMGIWLFKDETTGLYI